MSDSEAFKQEANSHDQKRSKKDFFTVGIGESADIQESGAAREALRKSEEKYRSLFNSIDEGFCTIEVLFDENEKAVDYRFLETNPTFDTQTGLADATGRTMLELLPNHEEFWFETYGKVALSGESIRFEAYAAALNRWFSVYAQRVNAEPQNRQVAIVFSDISERKRADEALRRSEERYRTLFETMDEAYYVIEVLFDRNNKPVDYRFLESNPAFEKLTGLKDATGKTVRELVPEIEEFWIEKYGEVALTGEANRYSNCVAGLNNRWYDGYAFRLGGEESRQVAIIFSEITTRKQAEEKLKKSEERLSLAASVSGFGIHDFDAAKNRLYWSPELKAMHGLAPEAEITMETMHEFIHADDRERMKRAVRAALDPCGDGGFEQEFRITRRDNGETRWLYNKSQTHFAGAGKKRRPVRNAGIVVDLTDPRRAEQALRESEERLRLLIENAQDYAIIGIAPDSRIETWSAGAEKIFGYTEDEIIGERSGILFTPEDRAARVPEGELEAVLEKGIAEDERFHQRKDGSRFFMSGVVRGVADGGDELLGFVKIARDMTERIKAEKVQRDKETLQKLVGAQEMERKRIARDLHDELGQQLTALRLKLETVRQLCEDDDELCAAIDDTQTIAKSIDNGVDFLAWELRPSVLDDLGLSAAVKKYLREWSHYSGVSSEFIASGKSRIRLSSEAETNLYRIAQEALNNVYKHAKAQKAGVMLEKRNDSVVLIIEDDGAGFNPENKKNRGKGLGLIGMEERAALVGGTVEIESNPGGGGTTVYVRVPLSHLDTENKNDE
jgi:PAS domain S-box-containing protein